MRLAMLLIEGVPQPVRVDAEGQRYWPLAELAPGLPSDMAGVIAALAGGARIPEPTGPGQALPEEKLLAPLPNPPRNIFCVGKNYHAHAKEFAGSGYDSSSTSAADAVPKAPIIFSKPYTSISGPWDDIPLWPGLDQGVDYEAELAVVIGQGGRNIARQDALRHVFGYTLVNDVTARDLQGTHKQWLLGKGIDGFCPMGPWIVTADEIGARPMRITCQVNGEARQDASTADLIFDVPELIETISRSMALLPGDVIATGTPEGVGIGFRPPRFLREGDVVECAIEGIGRIRNRLRRTG
ncbi:fumarylacetoacetate hydrolase family protein [Pseudoroseomonas cervicalis]|uniref:fumarylacetoacetate hydrolase family protein n=1 Tax=Teichococcus cervicalis TaxID=204525 RepID=UPI002782D0BE|nr:fumarylacetoacetate hydrolase family protein [Pseudoroseomonas cervicalis]MDQ1079605.1 2-keto-4-pentenoate hydratase/2-oxohepta-3-ene-1,7-dioic acid hydratase in catechol pathway [Pseudoroseomonas cervicalis]